MLLKLKSMEERVKEIQEGGAPIIMFGTGEKSRGTLPILLSYGISPACFCDNDPAKWGKLHITPSGEYDIFSPKQCRQQYPNAVYVLCVSAGNYPAVVQSLRGCRVYSCCYPFKVDPKMLAFPDDAQHRVLQEMANALADETSREVFHAAINYKLNGDLAPLLAISEGDGYFDPLLAKCWESGDTYIDCGAYSGDTMIQFLCFCQGRYGKIRLFEGDHNNCAWLRKMVDHTRIRDTFVHEGLLWDEKTKLEFYTYDISSDDVLYENADTSAWRKDNPCSRRKDELENISTYATVRQSADRLDHLVDPEENIGMIKIVLVGGEMNVLKGCESILREKKSAVIIEWAGCQENDVWEMIPFLLECQPEYKIYLRQKNIWQSSKTMLYAI